MPTNPKGNTQDTDGNPSNGSSSNGNNNAPRRLQVVLQNPRYHSSSSDNFDNDPVNNRNRSTSRQRSQSRGGNSDTNESTNANPTPSSSTPNPSKNLVQSRAPLKSKATLEDPTEYTALLEEVKQARQLVGLDNRTARLRDRQVLIKDALTAYRTAQADSPTSDATTIAEQSYQSMSRHFSSDVNEVQKESVLRGVKGWKLRWCMTGKERNDAQDLANRVRLMVPTGDLGVELGHLRRALEEQKQRMASQKKLNKPIPPAFDDPGKKSPGVTVDKERRKEEGKKTSKKNRANVEESKVEEVSGGKEGLNQQSSSSSSSSTRHSSTSSTAQAQPSARSRSPLSPSSSSYRESSRDADRRSIDRSSRDNSHPSSPSSYQYYRRGDESDYHHSPRRYPSDDYTRPARPRGNSSDRRPPTDHYYYDDRASQDYADREYVNPRNHYPPHLDRYHRGYDYGEDDTEYYSSDPHQWDPSYRRHRGGDHYYGE